jgi:hypothetical protein
MRLIITAQRAMTNMKIFYKLPEEAVPERRSSYAMPRGNIHAPRGLVQKTIRLLRV